MKAHYSIGSIGLVNNCCNLVNYISLNRETFMLFFKPRALWFIIYVISIKSLELQKDHVTLSIYFVKLHFKASQLLDFLWKSLRKKTVRLIIFLSCQLHGSISRMRSAFFTLLKWHNLDLTLDETTLLPYFFLIFQQLNPFLMDNFCALVW